MHKFANFHFIGFPSSKKQYHLNYNLWKQFLHTFLSTITRNPQDYEHTCPWNRNHFPLLSCKFSYIPLRTCEILGGVYVP